MAFVSILKHPFFVTLACVPLLADRAFGLCASLLAASRRRVLLKCSYC